MFSLLCGWDLCFHWVNFGQVGFLLRRLFAGLALGWVRIGLVWLFPGWLWLWWWAWQHLSHSNTASLFLVIHFIVQTVSLLSCVEILCCVNIDSVYLVISGVTNWNSERKWIGCNLSKWEVWKGRFCCAVLGHLCSFFLTVSCLHIM